MFHQLYWIIVFSELLVANIVFPGASIIQGGFPSETVPGRICLLLPTTSIGKRSDSFYESESYKLNMFRLFFPLLIISIIICLRFRVKRFVSELCPRKQMSCIGVYKRNVISLRTTIQWLMFWNIGVLLEFAFCTLLTVRGDYFSPQTLFWIWNAKDFLLNEGSHFALPLLLEVPNNSLERNKNTFYARNPGILEPRRAEVKRSKKKVELEPRFLVLSASELLSQRKVPSKVIKVAEYRGDYMPNVSRRNIEDKSLQNMSKPELKDERWKPEKLEVSIQDLPKMPQKCTKGIQNDQLGDQQRGEREKTIQNAQKMPERFRKGAENDQMEERQRGLSIPRSTYDEDQLRRRHNCIFYCRNHNTFAKH